MKLETIMMIAFILGLILMMWKLYVFIPTKPLKDDDRTPEATQKLEEIMVACIKAGDTDIKKLFLAMQAHEKFDKEHFWRFNENRLRHLLDDYLFRKKLNSVEEIRSK